MSRYKYHGTATPAQQGLRGEREPVTSSRCVLPEDRVLLIKSDGPNKRYQLTKVEKITAYALSDGYRPRTITLLHTNGLREETHDLAMTWDEEKQHWFIWA